MHKQNSAYEGPSLFFCLRFAGFGGSMRKRSLILLLLVFFAAFFLLSCSDASKSYEQGKYADAIKILDNKDSLSAQEYLLKARCYLALDSGSSDVFAQEAALKNVTLYLLLSSDKDENRAEAVSYFVQLNTYNSLAIMVLSADDGLDAQIALFKAYCQMGYGYEDEALAMIEKIEEQVSSMALLELLVDYGNNLSYTTEAFTLCLEELTDENKEEYLDLLCRYSESSGLGETQAHSCLAISDTLMEDEFYNSNNLILSKLLKTKGNILDKLYDRINARVYWNQALRLNPNDSTLKDKLQ